MARIVVSASRRTDIPAFYMPWFMDQIKQGYFEVENPYNRRMSTVTAEADQVHSIVFWSKDYGVFLEHGYGDRLIAAGYHLYFNFTHQFTRCNSGTGHAPPAPAPGPAGAAQRSVRPRHHSMALRSRLPLYRSFRPGSRTIWTNFPPLPIMQELWASPPVSPALSIYTAKSTAGRTKLRHFAFRELSLERKIDIIGRMAAYLNDKDMALHLCCEKEVLAALPDTLGVRGAACISARASQRALRRGDLHAAGHGAAHCSRLRLQPGQRYRQLPPASLPPQLLILLCQCLRIRLP